MLMLFLFSSFILFYTYILYPILLNFLANFTSESLYNDDDFFPEVSLIIAAYNEEKVIENKIFNSLNLDYPKDKFEVIIGSDGSTDKTNEILKKYENNIVKIKLNKERTGKANTLNMLVPDAKGKIIVFSDANTFLEKDAIKNIIKPFVNPKIGGVCGELKLVNPNENPGGKGEGLYWLYEKKLKKLESSLHSTIGANGGIYAIRKVLFRILPQNVIVDDFIISMGVINQGYRLIYNENAVAYEDTSLSLVDEFKRKIRIGAGNFQSIRLLKPLLSFKNKRVAFSFWSHKIFRWLIPFDLILLFISNVFIMDRLFFFMNFLMQLLLYLLALIGYMLDKNNKKLGKIYIPYYFISMNLALLIGFIRFLNNQQKVTWEKMERSV